MPQQPDKGGNKRQVFVLALPRYCFPPTSPCSRRNIIPRELSVQLHTDDISVDFNKREERGGFLHNATPRQHATRGHKVAEIFAIEHLRASEGESILPIVWFGADIYRNPTEECERSPFRLLEMLYVYLILPEPSGVFVCLFEDTQSHFETGLKSHFFLKAPLLAF